MEERVMMCFLDNEGNSCFFPECCILRNEGALRVLEILDKQGKDSLGIFDYITNDIYFVIYIDEAVPTNSPETAAWQQRLLALCQKFDLPVYYGHCMAYRDCDQYFDGDVIGVDADVMMVGGQDGYGLCFTPEEIAKMILEAERYPGPTRIPMESMLIREMKLTGCLPHGVDVRDAGRALIEYMKGHVHENEAWLFYVEEDSAFGKYSDWYETGSYFSMHSKEGTLCGMMQRLPVRTALFGHSYESPDMVFDLSSVEPSIDVGEGRIVKTLSPKPVNAVWIGGMYGGTMEDIELAAKTLRGKKVASGVRLSVSPCTAEIYADAADRGYLTDIMEAGGMVLPQCASPREQARIGEDELMVSNDNHNEKDYAGGTIYLSSTYKAIEAALTGYISLGTSAEKAVEAPKADLPPKKEISQPVQPSEGRKEEGPAVLRGKVWKFGDDIDTDIIMPTQHLSYADWEEVKRHLFEPLRPELAAKLSEGDIIVAGNNFGCGSSREQAAEAIATSGIRCIIAKSFARIFFRNAINNGVLLIECPELPDHVAEGDTVEVVINSHISHNGKTYAIPKMPENLYRLIKAGGLVKSVIGDSGQG